MPRTSQRATKGPATDRAATDRAATGETKQPAPTRKAASARRRAADDKPARAKRSTKSGGKLDGAAERAGSGQPDEATADLIDVNLVVLKGRLAADAEYRTYESGATALRLLVTIRLTEPRQRIDVIPVTMWDPTRELVRKPPVRGDHVWLTGNVQRRFWETPDGRRSRMEVVAHEVKRVEPAAGDPTG
jgi:hypothetical protein